MGLHVDEGGAVGASEGRQRTDLIQDVGLDLLGIDGHLTAAEAPEVPISGMRPDRGARGHGPCHGPVHHPRVPGVEPAGHVDRRHRGEEAGFVLERPRTEPLARIDVQIEGGAHTRGDYASTLPS